VVVLVRRVPQASPLLLVVAAEGGMGLLVDLQCGVVLAEVLAGLLVAR